MSEQFGRILILSIGQAGGEARTSTGLRVVARVTYKSARAGEAEIEVYNPAPLTVAAAQAKGAIFRLLGGYDVPELIFEGTAIRDGVMVRKEGPDRILSVSARTGGTQLERARVSLSFAGVTSAVEVIDKCIEALGLPTGVVFVEDDYEIPAGFAYTGSAQELLTRITAGAGANLTVRDGAVQILPAGQDTGEQVARLTPDTGLIGSPVRRTGKERGLVEAKAQLIPGLRPGKRVVIESATASGVFTARDVGFELDLMGDFAVSFTAREQRAPARGRT